MSTTLGDIFVGFSPLRIDGFHAIENHGGSPLRWTTGHGSLTLEPRSRATMSIVLLNWQGVLDRTEARVVVDGSDLAASLQLPDRAIYQLLVLPNRMARVEILSQTEKLIDARVAGVPVLSVRLAAL